MNNLVILINKVNDLLNDNKYIADYKLIKKLYDDLMIIDNDLTYEVINEIDDIINELNDKYIELCDLVNVFDSIKYQYKKDLHNIEVKQLRDNNKKLRENS